MKDLETGEANSPSKRYLVRVGALSSVVTMTILSFVITAAVFWWARKIGDEDPRGAGDLLMCYPCVLPIAAGFGWFLVSQSLVALENSQSRKPDRSSIIIGALAGILVCVPLICMFFYLLLVTPPKYHP